MTQLDIDNTQKDEIRITIEVSPATVEQLSSTTDLWKQIRKARARCTLCVKKFGAAPTQDNLRLLSRSKGDVLVCEQHMEWVDATAQVYAAPLTQRNLGFVVYSPETGGRTIGNHADYVFGGEQ